MQKKTKQLSKIEEIRKNAMTVRIKGTEEYMQKLHSKLSCKIISDYPTINTLNCDLIKGNRCFEYSADEILPYGPPVKFQHKSYGYQDPFKLANKETTFNAFKGAAKIKINIGKGFTSNGEFWELETETFNKTGYYRALLPVPKFCQKPLHFIESKSFNTENSFRAAGYIQLNIKNYNFGIFDYDLNKQDYLIIDCFESITQEQFESIIFAILYCYGFISGSLIRDEIIILQFEDSKTKAIGDFHYRRIGDSLNGKSVIHPRLLQEINNDNSNLQLLTVSVFENLVNKSLNDLRLLRSIRIITESFKYPHEIRASTFSVVLETLKNIIIEENDEKLNPFKSKEEASQAIKKLQKIITEIDDEKFNNKDSVLKRINQINQIGNRESFVQTFKILNIELNADDLRCINMRNDFLHGRIPFDKENDTEDFQLIHVVFKLHFLVSSIIMKYSGYSGLILNNIKLSDILYFQKNLKEPLFRRI